jgi:alcohol dehydrogenase, propanol-preferring
MSNEQFTIPKTQKAAIIPAKGESLVIKEDHHVAQQNELKPGECLVKIEATGALL